METTENVKAAQACRKCERWAEVSEKVRVRELLEKTIEKFEAKISDSDYTPTVAEYLKLLQMEHDVGQEDEGIKEITVTWVEPNTER